MRTYYFLIACILLLACSGPVEESENTLDEIVEITDGPYKYDQNLSKACNLCLLEDSIHETNKLLATYKATKQDYTQVKEDMELMELQRDDLEEKYGSDFSSALDDCLEEFTFNDVGNKTEEAEMLTNFRAYYGHIDLPMWAMDEDTSEFREGNFYRVKARGEIQEIPLDEFADYWNRSLNSWQVIMEYKYQKLNESSKPFTGKDYRELSKIELMMFVSYAGRETEGDWDAYEEVIDQDTYLESLIDTWSRSLVYEK